MKNNIYMRQINARNLDIITNIKLEFNKNNSILYNVQKIMVSSEHSLVLEYLFSGDNCLINI